MKSGMELANLDSVVVPAIARTSQLMDYLTLTKPEVTFLVIIATGVGGLMAAPFLNPLPLFHALFGTALVAGGAATLNHYIERFPDARMRRTANRPLPAGRLAPSEVFRFGLALSVAGVLDLALFVNVLTSLIGLAALLSYLWIYTPLKRKTALCTFIGAFPGAAPVLMGWAAVRNNLDVEAWLLYFILFAWQFPHFLSIAWMYRDDYARAGMLMLPTGDSRGDSTFRCILVYSAALIALSLVPTFVGMAGEAYLISAAALGAILFYFAYRASVQRTRIRAKHLLHVTVIYLPLLFAALVLNKVA